jgi:hypothetical protein
VPNLNRKKKLPKIPDGGFIRESIPLVSVVIPTHNRKREVLRLLHSVFKSHYPKNKLEIIVVDDASTDGTYEAVKEAFPKVVLLRNDKDVFVSASRNIGIERSKGKYIFLVDDDNVISDTCILNLVKTANHNDLQIGIIAPIMYYLKQPNRIWCAGSKRNMITSLTKKIGGNETDNGQFNGLIESKDFPNAFMIKKKVIEKAGSFDDKNFPCWYEEADFCERARKVGFRIVCNPEAKVWHDMPLPEKIEEKTRLFHVHDEFHAYYAGRNRILFHKKYSKRWQFLIFILVFNWLFTLYYIKVILFGSKKPLEERFKIAKAYLSGVIEGLK